MLEDMENDKESALLTEEEAAVYDRQIRLWGVESQKRLRKAKVLLVGLGSLGNEVCKNIVLAGIEHLTIVDHRQLTKEEEGDQFLAPQGQVNKLRVEQSYNRAKDLNPMVDLKIDSSEISSKDEDFFSKFGVVCLIGCSKDEQIRVDRICRASNVKFFSANCFANYSYFFADLGKHRYTEEAKKVQVGHIDTNKENGESPSKKAKEVDDSDVDIVEKLDEFVSFENAISDSVFKGTTEKQIAKSSKAYFVLRVMLKFHERNGRFPTLATKGTDWEDMLSIRDEVMEAMCIASELLPDSFVSFSLGTLYPAACIVGGVLSQEIIKCVSGAGRPHNNFFFYDGTNDDGTVEKIYSRIS